MRLILTLRSTYDCQYETEYHYHIQGFIYNLLRKSKFHNLHDKDGYKFFCFSNIFPFSETIYKNEVRKLIISSPDPIFIETTSLSLKSFSNNTIKIGKMKFELINVENVKPVIPIGEPFSLITGTPIIIRIPREKFAKHKSYLLKDFSYFYWKKDFPLELFIDQLEKSLIKKYNEYFQYTKKQLPSSELVHLFERFRFKKQVSTTIKLKQFSYKVIGTLWELNFEDWANMNLIEFALDSGLGERNSLGFGFMNIQSDSRRIFS